MERMGLPSLNSLLLLHISIAMMCYTVILLF
jgi:hypothetical protein